tara:strand:- start:14970 stop:15872 length:903 start_codon:yes stop_codon:yes gene_type:complete
MINEKPLISIIVNCFNGEKYLREALSSILDQSYKNWEVIFWDNQSTDSSAEIYKSFKDKRFKYFYSNEHTSLYKARNLAIERAQGDFISFLDTDDLWDKKKLEALMPYFKEPDVGVVFGNIWLVKKNIEKKKLHAINQLPRGKVYDDLIKNYNISIISNIIRKNFYLKLDKKFDERFNFIGDFDLFLRLSKICKFESIQEPIAYYRLHGRNLTTINKEKEVEEFELWLKENKNNLKNFQIENFKNKIKYKEFVNCKIDGNYRKCINMILNKEISLLNLKNLLIFFTPILFLKKLLWYHQD